MATQILTVFKILTKAKKSNKTISKQEMDQMEIHHHRQTD